MFPGRERGGAKPLSFWAGHEGKRLKREEEGDGGSGGKVPISSPGVCTNDHNPLTGPRPLVCPQADKLAFSTQFVCVGGVDLHHFSRRDFQRGPWGSESHAVTPGEQSEHGR